MPKWDAWLGRPGRRRSARCSPRCRRTSARSGPCDLLDTAPLGLAQRGLDVRTVGDVTRLMAMSIADLLDDWFESPQVKGALAVNGVIGTWAGPVRAGHRLRHGAPLDRRRRRRPPRQLGLPRGRHGRRLGGDRAASARASAPRSAPNAAGASGARRRGGRVTRRGARRTATSSTRPDGGHERCTRRPRSSSTLDRTELPDDFVARHRALEDPQRRRQDQPGAGRAAQLHRRPGTTCPSTTPARSRWRRRWSTSSGPSRTPARARPALRPFSDGVIPTTFDRTLSPEGTHIMSLFTQWVPTDWADEPHTEELEAYADRMIDLLRRGGAQLQGARSCTATSSGRTRWSRSTA